MLTNFRKFPFHSLHFKLQKTCLPDILKGLLLGRIFRQTEGNTAETGLFICPSPVARCSCWPWQHLPDPTSTRRGHCSQQWPSEPMPAASLEVWHCLPQNPSRMCNLITITQQSNSPLQSSDRKCRLTHLHLSDGVIARLHIQMSICLTVWYTDRADTLEAKFTPVVISLTPVAITQRTNLAHSVS